MLHHLLRTKFLWWLVLALVAMLKDLATLMVKHTVLSRRHLTPELAIRVVDQSCALWSLSSDCTGGPDQWPDQWPFKDPFWAFYWPGGQVTARYILDNENIVKDRRVLDVGCGCGASSIASVKMKAKRVVANDIDLYALAAAGINAEANGVEIEVSGLNLIGSKCEEFDTILVGDLFYDPEFSKKLFQWLKKLHDDGKTVLIGDPGRHGLTDEMRDQITLLSTYTLPPNTCLENYGFVDASVWKVGAESRKK